MRTITLPNEEVLPEVAKMLSEGTLVIMKTKGRSMLPFIVGGRDSVILQKEDVYNVGDIVLAEIFHRMYVLHRIISIDRDEIVLMGDGNLSGTEECHKRNICGRVVCIVYDGHKVDCNSKFEKQKAHIWQLLLPIRRYLLAIYIRIKI